MAAASSAVLLGRKSAGSVDDTRWFSSRTSRGHARPAARQSRAPDRHWMTSPVRPVTGSYATVGAAVEVSLPRSSRWSSRAWCPPFGDLVMLTPTPSYPDTPCRHARTCSGHPPVAGWSRALRSGLHHDRSTRWHTPSGRRKPHRAPGLGTPRGHGGIAERKTSRPRTDVDTPHGRRRSTTRLARFSFRPWPVVEPIGWTAAALGARRPDRIHGPRGHLEGS